MRISVMTYSLDPGGYGVENYPSIIAEAGAEGINWVSCYGRKASDLRKMTLDAGLDVSCHTFALKTLCRLGVDWHDEAKAGIDNAAELGTHRIMVVPMPPKGVKSLEENRRCWIEVLQEMSEMAQKAGIVLTIENFQGCGSAFVTSDDLMDIRQALPSLRFTFDAGNAATGGEAPEHGPSLLGNAIEFVHFKDYIRCDNPDFSSRTLRGRDGNCYEPTVFGNGCVRLDAALKALHEQNYDGWIDVEYEGVVPESRQGVAQDVRWLKEKLTFA